MYLQPVFSTIIITLIWSLSDIFVLPTLFFFFLFFPFLFHVTHHLILPCKDQSSILGTFAFINNYVAHQTIIPLPTQVGPYKPHSFGPHKC